MERGTVMKELVCVLLMIISAIFLFLHFKGLNILILIFIFVLIFYFVTKEVRMLYLVIIFVFYFYLNFITYTGNITGEKNFHVKFDGKTGTVLSVENKYVKEKILINNNKNLTYGYYKVNCKIDQVKEKNGILMVKVKTISYENSRFNKIRDFISDKFSELFSSEYKIYGFSKAAILGEKADLGEELNDMFKYTGLAHLIVISGLHIGLVMIVFIKIFEKLGVSYKMKYIMTLILLTIYCIITGFSVSVLRSYLMGAIMIFSKLLFEENNSKKSFFISMIIVLIISPYSLFDISFQLSYGAVGSILFVVPVIEEVYKLKYKVESEFLDYTIRMLLLSFIIQIMSLPVFMYNFKVIPVFSFVSNIFGIPLGTLLIQIIFLSLLINIVNVSVFNIILNFIIKTIFDAFESLIYILNKLPLLQVNIDFQINIIHIIIYYGIIFIFLYFIRSYYLKTLSRKKIIK